MGVAPRRPDTTVSPETVEKGRASDAMPEAANRRLRMLMEIAAELDTGYTTPELTSLLPSEVSDRQVDDWLRAHPELARFDGEFISPSAAPSQGRGERKERGRRYREAAEAFVAGPMRPIAPWIRCIALTGSTAYGEPEAGDDIDFLVIARSGAVWVTLAFLYLAVRFGRRPLLDGQRPELCFNYVIEEGMAEAEFARPQGFLFAREALSVRVLQGSECYAGLLNRAAWMHGWVPRLYGDRGSDRPRPRGPPAEWPVRLLNLSIFPILSAYLQLVGLVRNRGFRSAGTTERSFAVRSEIGRLAFFSSRFDRLRGRYEALPDGETVPPVDTASVGGAGSGLAHDRGGLPAPPSTPRAERHGSEASFRDRAPPSMPDVARGSRPPA